MSANTDHVYDDVEGLLFPGYLTETVVASGVSVSVRSMFPSEYHYVQVRSASFTQSHEWKRLMVIQSVWEVDGHVVGGDDMPARRRLYDFTREWTGAVIDAVYSATSKVRWRVTEAAKFIEAYCYEDMSRNRWRTGGRRCPSVESPSWVSSLGSNQMQRAWVGYNLAEDDRQRWDNEWYAAKTITSAMVPKWVKQVTDRETARWKTEEDRRRSVINRARTGRSEDQPSDGMVVVRHRTNDDLVEQMKRWQRGELDDHDTIVASYKEGIRQRHAEAAQRHAERMAEVERISAEVYGQASTITGYTPEQLSEMGVAAPERTRRIYDGSHPGRLYDKYLSTDIRVGGLRPDGKGGEMTNPREPISDALGNRRVTMPTPSKGV